tara:strand:+ start:1052 stop:2032 length:981 start_codon:yes stop_codon:yes gene_type:complete
LIKDIFQISKSAGRRLDIYLAKKLHPISRSRIKTYINDSSILVNDFKAKPGYIIQKGDIIEVSIKNEAQDDESVLPEKMKINVIYEDDHIIGINKPSGLVVHPGVKNKQGTLVNGLINQYKNLSNINGDSRRGIVHRLDADTSGVMLVAKTNEAHEWLSNQFKERSVRKTYFSITWGKWKEQSGKIEGWISRKKSDPTTYQLKDSDQYGKHSITNYKVEKQYDNFARVLFYPITGRTHQIRIHSSHLGHPVFGDQKYGGDQKKCKGFQPDLKIFFSEKLDKFGRHALHALSIEFEPYKNNGKKIKLDAPIPNEFVYLEKSIIAYET